jgi:hypothetical protein
MELSEKAKKGSERVIGLTMAVVAALLAATTLVGHRLHTEETVAQTKSADGWAYFQAKNGRYHLYATDAELAGLLVGEKGQEVAERWKRKAEDERREAEEVRKENELRDRETEATARRATYFDVAEICLEVSLVLCSIALLTGALLFWRLSFVGTVIALVTVAVGWWRA